MQPRILLVDDEPNLLDGLRRALRDEPWAILTATSARDALALLDREPADVVVSDQEMPGMCGVEFLKKVSEAHPETVCFILTGKASLDLAVQSINEGHVSQFLMKPCDGKELARTIRKALEHKALVCESARLLEVSRRQSSLIEKLEKENPGISKVERDSEGNVVLDVDLNDAGSLTQAIRRQLNRNDTDASA